MPTFADRLRELREGAGMTQAELALASGLPLGAIRNYEQGQREPLWDVVFRLAAAMKVGCEAFKVCVPDGRPVEAASSPARPRPAGKLPPGPSGEKKSTGGKRRKPRGS